MNRYSKALLFLLATVLSAPVAADFLIWSGETFWQGDIYGVIVTPTGVIVDTDAQTQDLIGRIIDEGDVIVYDVTLQTYEIFEQISVSELIDSELAGYDVASEGSIYWEASGAFECAPGAEQMNAAGVVVHIGAAFSVLCDSPHSGVSGPPGDTDNDGVPNTSDNCPTVGNADQANNDGDSQGDVCDDDDDNDGLSDEEEARQGTDPFNPDTDGDGLLDGQEIVLGTNPLDDDTDNDGIPDGEEVAEGLDPLDGSDCPSWICGGLSPAIQVIIQQRRSETQ